VREYREPFVGGGGVFFKARFNHGLERFWLNDKHQGLMEVYRALVERPEEFARLCRQIEPARSDDEMTEVGPRGGKPVNKRLYDEFHRVAFEGDPSKCDQAYRYFFVNRTVHGSGQVNYDIPSRLFFSNPEGWNVTAGDQLEGAARALAGVKVTCGDYSSLFEAPGEDVWIYADPPYVVNSGLHPTSQLYQHSFTMEDHRRFAETVKRCKHKVTISYDDDGDGLVRELFPGSEGFFVVESGWSYCGTTSGRKENGKELLICWNYRPETIPGRILTLAPVFEDEECDLTEAETELRERYEDELRQCFRYFLRAGEILHDIQQNRLYRPEGTFAEYLRRVWGMSQPHAYQLINSCILVNSLKMLTMVSILPSSERVTRELLRIKDESGDNTDMDRVAEVWSELVSEHKETGAPITAKLVRSKVNEAIGYEPAVPRTNLDDFKTIWAKCSPQERAEITGVVLGVRKEQPCPLAI
jgi:DNA adenine methylase